MFSLSSTEDDFSLLTEDADPLSETLMHKKVRGLVKSVQNVVKTAKDARTQEQIENNVFIPSSHNPNILQNDFSFCSSWELSSSTTKTSSKQKEEKDLQQQGEDILPEELVFEISNENNNGNGLKIQTSNVFEFIVNRAYLWRENQNNNNEEKKSTKKKTKQQQQQENSNNNNNGVTSVLLSATIVSKNLTSTTVTIPNRNKEQEQDDENSPFEKDCRKTVRHNISIGVFNFGSDGSLSSSQLSGLCFPVDRNATVYFKLTPISVQNDNNSKNAENAHQSFTLRLCGKFQSRLDWTRYSTMLYGNSSLMPVHYRIRSSSSNDNNKKSSSSTGRRKNSNKSSSVNPKDGLFPPHRNYFDDDDVHDENNKNNTEKLISLSHQPQLDVLSMKDQQLRCLSACFFHRGKNGDAEAIVDTFGCTQGGMHISNPTKTLIELQDEIEGNTENSNKNNKTKNKNSPASPVGLEHFLTLNKIEPRRWSPLLILHHPKFKQFKIRYTPASSSRPVNIRRFPHRNADIVGEVKFGQVLEASRVVYDELNRDWYVEWNYLSGFSRLWGSFGPFLIALWPNMETTVLDPPRFFAPASGDSGICVRVRTAPDIYKGKKTGNNLLYNEVRAAVAVHKSLRKGKADYGSVYVEWADGSGYSRKSGRVLKESFAATPPMYDGVGCGEMLLTNTSSVTGNNDNDEVNNDAVGDMMMINDEVALGALNDDENQQRNNQNQSNNIETEEEQRRQEELINRIARDIRRQRRVGLARRSNRNHHDDFTPAFRQRHHHDRHRSNNNNNHHQNNNTRNERNLAESFLNSIPGRSEYERVLNERQLEVTNDDDQDPDETMQTFPTTSSSAANNNNFMTMNNNNNNSSSSGTGSGFPPPVITPRRRRRRNDNNSHATRRRNLHDQNVNSEVVVEDDDDEDEDDENDENDDDTASSSSLSTDDVHVVNDDNDDDESVLDEENYEERNFLVELPQIRSALMKMV